MTRNALMVLAECVDARSGRRFAPGETFDPAPTLTQARRLISAGCLPEEALNSATDDPTPVASSTAATVTAIPAVAPDDNADGLFDLGKEDLQDIILNERVPIDEDAIRAVVVASIRRHRTKLANGTADVQRTQALEAANREPPGGNTGDDVASSVGDGVDPNAQPQPKPENIEMRTEDGERAAREADAASRERQSQEASSETGSAPKPKSARTR